jgi:hypothetical protein
MYIYINIVRMNVSLAQSETNLRMGIVKKPKAENGDGKRIDEV